MSAWPFSFVLVVCATFLLGGIVKGAVGFGLPLVVVATLTPIYGLKTALALLIVPALVTNATQALTGGHLGELLNRLWSYLAAIAFGMFFGVKVLAIADPRTTSAMLGLMLSFYALAALMDWELPHPDRHERLLTPAVGLLNGTLSGMTGVYVFPAVLYLRAIRLERDGLIQAMGLVFLVSTLSLGANLAGRGLLPGNLALASLASVVPALLGQWLGQAVRRRLSETLFRRLFLAALLVVGVSILVRALLL